MEKTNITKRSFKRDGCRIIQNPSEVELVKYSSSCEKICGKLSLISGLFYLGVVDSGEDYFKVSLAVERPTRWNDGIPETITIVRQFLSNISQIKEWALSLETVILDAIFPMETADDESKKARKNHVVMKILLELTKDFTELDLIIREDAEKRSRLLDSTS